MSREGLSLGILAVVILGWLRESAKPPPVSTKRWRHPKTSYFLRVTELSIDVLVTSQGVISHRSHVLQRPGQPYIDAIKSVTDKAIKYVIYSPHP